MSLYRCVSTNTVYPARYGHGLAVRCYFWDIPWALGVMMASSNGNSLRVTGLCAGSLWVPGEFPSQRQASEAELWCFLWFAPEQTFEQIIEAHVIWNTTKLIMTWLQSYLSSFICFSNAPMTTVFASLPYCLRNNLNIWKIIPQYQWNVPEW